MDFKQRIKDFLEKETQSKVTDENQNLIQTGILDSFSMIRLLGFIEKEIGVTVNMENLSADNFNSLANIIDAIQSYGNKAH